MTVSGRSGLSRQHPSSDGDEPPAGATGAGPDAGSASLLDQLFRAREDVAGWRRAAERSALLASASTVGAAAADLPDGMRRLGALLVPAQADWCLLDRLTGDGTAERVAVVHRDPERVPAGSDGLLAPGGSAGRGGSPGEGWARVAAGGDSEHLVDLTVDLTGRAGAPRPRGWGELALLSELGASSALVLPLRARGRTFGVLTLCRDAPGSGFEPADRELLADLAGRASLVLDGVRLAGEQRRVAEVLQRAMLSDLPDGDDAEAVARYRPAAAAAEVGGDWYDAFTLDGGTLTLVIGDVAGHDLQAAQRMGQLRSMLRALAFDRREPPAEVLRRLDDLVQSLGVAETATCLYGLLEPADPEQPEGESGSRLFRWASAGHPPPLLITADGRAVLLESTSDLLLGVDLGVPRTDLSVRLASGSTLVLYTDGLVESRGQDLDVGLTRLRQAGTALADRPLPALADGLLERLGGTDDDVALLAVRLPLRAGTGRPAAAGPGDDRDG